MLMCFPAVFLGLFLLSPTTGKPGCCRGLGGVVGQRGSCSVVYLSPELRRLAAVVNRLPLDCGLMDKGGWLGSPVSHHLKSPAAGKWCGRVEMDGLGSTFPKVQCHLRCSLSLAEAARWTRSSIVMWLPQGRVV
ncbi:unnamed protein product [Cuscuta europaea]|uniref:Secreted protein n=1 Tax=Cuscuta europaea TaxID=41803 RepID=A0A9P1DZ18_CUSEU|nr:unnamed protein product [Cuscuta europaea]